MALPKSSSPVRKDPSPAVPLEGAQKRPRGAETAPAKKKRRFRPGTVALREIKRYQKTTDRLLPRLPFERVVREVCQDIRPDALWTRGALDAVQEAAEQYLTEWFKNMNEAATHAGRKGIYVRDARYVAAAMKQK